MRDVPTGWRCPDNAGDLHLRVSREAKDIVDRAYHHYRALGWPCTRADILDMMIRAHPQMALSDECYNRLNEEVQARGGMPGIKYPRVALLEEAVLSHLGRSRGYEESERSG